MEDDLDDLSYQRQQDRANQLEDQAIARAKHKAYYERTAAEERLLEDGECEE